MAVLVPLVSDSIPGLIPREGFSFRRGQEVFLRKLATAFSDGDRFHLGVFVPGYGKTITALASFLVARACGIANRLVIFVPRGNLRDQYADAQALSRIFRQLSAPTLTFCVADSDQVFLKNLETDIVITTYQYASGEGGHKALLTFVRRCQAMFVFDEVHHLSEDGTWAQGIAQFPHACSVALSGTPMRSDNKTLFGVPLEVGPDGDQYYRALHEVSLREAHAEGGILKRVAAHVLDYRLRMVRSDTGEQVEMSLSELRALASSSKEIDAFLARKQLRFHEVYLHALLHPAFERFAVKRAELSAEMRHRGVSRGAFVQHQMLIIAMSNQHAAAILAWVKQHFPRWKSARIGQDLPASEIAHTLEAYRNGMLDVMVQVDMIGEGTDIKPISVIVKADLVRAFSKTLQQAFRGMRYLDAWSEEANVCDLFAADDADLVEVLNWITEEAQIGMRARRARQETLANSGSTTTQERSKWQLTHVEHRQSTSHALELAHSSAQGSTKLTIREVQPAIDLAAREKVLRKVCSDLAVELVYALQARGQQVTVKQIHARARQQVGRSQAEQSLRELEQKRKWLERCLHYGKLL